MKIDQKLMTADQSKFEILAFQINEDDGICRPDCVPITYNVTTSSIHGNVFITPTYESNVRSSLDVHESKNELSLNKISFTGNLNDANMALRSMQFEPLCPFDTDIIVQLNVHAQAQKPTNDLE